MMKEIESGICQNHWDVLKKEISFRGLDHLVSKSGEDAAARMVSRTQANFEPLLSSMMAIMGNAFTLFSGPWKGCPLCVLDEKHYMMYGEGKCTDPKCEGPSSAAMVWITHAADDALDFAQSNGLLKEKS